MNREIKFRVWAKHYEEFFTSKDKDFMIGLDGKLYGRKNINSAYEDWSDYYEIQQFTGLKDKNGIKIYEGDVVKYWDEFLEVFHNLEVKFGEYNDDEGYGTDKHYGYYAKGKQSISKKYEGCSLNELEYTIIDLVNFKNPEIIGNIFENPELISTK